MVTSPVHCSVELLLAHGADTDLKSDYYGRTALMFAAYRNYPDIITALLSHGADDKIKDTYGKDALNYAEKEDSQDAFRVLTMWKSHRKEQHSNKIVNCQAQVRSPKVKSSKVKIKRTWADTIITWATTHPTHPPQPLTFKHEGVLW